jgi:type II secretory pathway component GspD/PulD (secretin)
MQRLLERLKRVWPSVAPNRLDVEEQPAEPGERPEKPAGEERAPSRAAIIKPAVTASQKQIETRVAFNEPEAADLRQDDAPPRRNESEGSGHDADGHPPVRITIGPQGLILSSPDTRALDQMEDLLGNLSPARSSFRVFALEHTYAKEVATLLKDIFKEEEENKKSKSQEFFETMYFGFSPNSSSSSKARSTLSKRRPVNFVPDPVTNTILVQNADEAQLAEIEHLIELYDRVEPPDSNSVRRTQMIPLKYAVAKQVGETIKDVYRDLLSPLDKALQQANAQKQQQEQQQRPMSLYSYLQMPEGTSEESKLPRFKGLLSVGIDELTNTLIVSAPQWLLTDVVAMAGELDRSAQPTRPVVNVLKLQHGGTPYFLKSGGGNGRRFPASSQPANGSPPPQPAARQNPPPDHD